MGALRVNFRTSVSGCVLLFAAACMPAPEFDRPRQGVLNVDPGTPLSDIRARLATEVCPDANTIEILAGPEPPLDPAKDQVQFRCTS